MKRRQFLKTSLMGLAGSGFASTVGASSQGRRRNPYWGKDDPNVFSFSRLRFKTLNPVNDHWNIGPNNDEMMLAYLHDVSNVPLTTRTFQERVIGVEDLVRIQSETDADSRLFNHPFLFMTGEGNFRFTDAEAQVLGEYLERGGFLWTDDCVTRKTGDFFFQASIREIQKANPSNEIRPVPLEHPIYHCFYDFPHGAPFCQGKRQRDMGLFIDNRLAAFMSPGDVHCGWNGMNRQLGYKADQETCFQFGVNVIINSLTH